MRVRLLGNEEAEAFGSTETVGLGGCGVVLARGFGVGALVEVQIPLEGGMVTADGRVAYELSAGGGEREVGIEFLRVPPRHLARIRPLLR